MDTEDLKWLQQLKPFVESGEVAEYRLYEMISTYSNLCNVVKRQTQKKKNLLEDIDVKRNSYKRLKRKLDKILVHEDQIQVRLIHSQVKELKDKLTTTKQERIKYVEQKKQLLNLERKKHAEITKDNVIGNLKKQIIKVTEYKAVQEEELMKKTQEYRLVARDVESELRKIKALHAEIAERERVKNNLTGKINLCRERPKLLKERNHTFEKQREKKKTIIRYKVLKMERLKAREVKKKQKIEAFEKSKEVMKCTVNNYRRLIKEEKESIEENKTLVEKFRKERIYHQKEIYGFKREYLQKKLELETLASKFKKIDSENSELARKREAGRKRVEYLENEVMNFTPETAKLNEKKVEIMKSLVNTKMVLSQLEDQVAVSVNHFIQGEGTEKKLNKKIKVIKKEMSELLAKVDHLKNEKVDDLKKMNKLYHERNEQQLMINIQKKLFVNIMSTVKTLSFENQELKKEKNDLKRTIVVVRKRRKYIEDQITKYRRSLSGFKSDIHTCQTELNLLVHEKKVMQRVGLEKEKNFMKIRMRLNNLIAENEKKRKQQNFVEKELEDMRDKIDDKRNQIRRLLRDIDFNEQTLGDNCNCFEKTKSDQASYNMELSEKDTKLALVYEKLNEKEGILRGGRKELAEKQKLAKDLKLILRDIQSELLVQKKRSSELKNLRFQKKVTDEKLEDLKKELKLVENNPKNFTRVRKIDSMKIIRKEVLVENIKELTEKISFRDEQIMEKNIILMELAKSSDRLRRETIQVRNQESMSTNQSLNFVYQRIRKENAKMKAFLSELSIYEAEIYAYKLKNENMERSVRRLRERIKTKEIKLDEVTETLSEKFQKKKRYEVVRKKLTQEEMERKTKTSAYQRPNSYIPNIDDDSVPLPVPYHGWSQPVVPKGIGANKRFLKKPKKRLLEI